MIARIFEQHPVRYTLRCPDRGSRFRSSTLRLLLQ
jgi:hypothetical protein